MKWKFLLFTPLFSLCAMEREEFKEERSSALEIPFEKGAFGLEFFGSALYWGAQVKGMKALQPNCDFQWNGGYRIGGALQIPVVRWEALCSYTDYETTSKERKGARTSLHTHRLLFELKKERSLTSLFALSTSLGVESGGIEAVQRKKDYKAASDFTGWGPYFGVGVQCHLHPSLTLRAQAGSSLLFGSVKMEQSRASHIVKKGGHPLTSTASLFLGATWNALFKGMRWSLSCGYESATFWEYRSMEITRFSFNEEGHLILKLEPNKQRIDLYGATLRARVEF